MGKRNPDDLPDDMASERMEPTHKPMNQEADLERKTSKVDDISVEPKEAGPKDEGPQDEEKALKSEKLKQLGKPIWLCK